MLAAGTGVAAGAFALLAATFVAGFCSEQAAMKSTPQAKKVIEMSFTGILLINE
jgi:hypothetical protein